MADRKQLRHFNLGDGTVLHSTPLTLTYLIHIHIHIHIHHLLYE